MNAGNVRYIFDALLTIERHEEDIQDEEERLEFGASEGMAQNRIARYRKYIKREETDLLNKYSPEEVSLAKEAMRSLSKKSKNERKHPLLLDAYRKLKPLSFTKYNPNNKANNSDFSKMTTTDNANSIVNNSNRL